MSEKIVITTRPVSANDELTDYLISRHIKVLSFPMIEIREFPLDEQIKDTLNHLHHFDFLIFTSKNGVSSFYNLLYKNQGNRSLPPEIKTIVIGEKTAKELLKQGLTASYISHGRTSGKLSEELRSGVIKENASILFVTGTLTPDFFEKSLEKYFKIKRINVYETVPPAFISDELKNILREDQYHLIVFTSPSGFDHFLAFMKNEDCLKSLKIACIGDTTNKAIVSKGYQPVLVSKKSTSLDLAFEIDQYLEKIKT